MHFVGATDETMDPFASFKFDGELGFALSQMSQGPDFSILDRLVAITQLEQQRFAVFLSDSDMEESEVTIAACVDSRLVCVGSRLVFCMLVWRTLSAR